LSRVGGNRRLYTKLLRDFVEKQGSAVEQISDALSHGDRTGAERLAHALKGVAGNLGAARVHAAAGRLEQMLRDGASAADVDAVRRDADEALRAVVTRLRVYAAASDDAAAPPPASNAEAAAMADAPSMETAARLVSLLSDSDPTAEEFLSANRSAIRPLFAQDGWSHFERLVSGYDFAGAQEQLAQALKDFAAIRRGG
jgi:two-component system sensor histidine kinase/response regulator